MNETDPMGDTCWSPHCLINDAVASAGVVFIAVASVPGRVISGGGDVIKGVGNYFLNKYQPRLPSSSSQENTKHGTIRLTNLTPAQIAAIKTGVTFKQADGATVYLKEEAPGRFGYIVEGSRGVVTAHNGARTTPDVGWALRLCSESRRSMRKWRGDWSRPIPNQPIRLTRAINWIKLENLALTGTTRWVY